MLGHAMAAFAAILLAAIAALHIYWGMGGYWPAKSELGLAQTVVGVTPGGRMPGMVACIAVAVALFVAALGPLAARGLLWSPLPVTMLQAVTLVGATVLGLRGIGGFFERRFRPSIVGLPYDRNNRLFYSPLCLLLSALLLASALLPA